MGLFSFLGKGGGGAGDLSAALATLAPCDANRQPILAFIEQHIAPDGTLSTFNEMLPDEETEPSGIRWAPGAMDGVWGSHGGQVESDAIAARIRGALEALNRSPDQKRARILYGYLMEQSALGAVDAVLEPLVKRWPVPGERLRQIARWLLHRAVDRNPVKYGIALLGVSGTDADRALLMTLGTHEEFTLFAAVALQHSAADVEESLWDLSKRVTGWGRVHTVKRLSDTERPEIRRWLLTEGCRNGVMPEYTALACATGGGLLEALSRDGAEADGPFLEGAGEIIRALLCRGGPAEEIDAYEDGPAAVDSYVECVARTARPALGQLETLVAIREFLEDEKVDWSRGSLATWSPQKRASLVVECRELIALPLWRGLIEEGLASRERGMFLAAAELSAHVRLDVWERRFERLKEGEDQWYWLMLSDDPARIRRVVEHALAALPLERLAAKPGTQILPSGPDARHHHALDWLVSALRRFPGEGWPLVRTAFFSPYTRARNMAVAALRDWPRDRWPADARAVIGSACGREPDPQLRAEMAKLQAR